MCRSTLDAPYACGDLPVTHMQAVTCSHAVLMQDLSDAFMRMFTQLPIAALVANTTLIMHGGEVLIS
jgi:hypothetical protein